MADAVGDVQGFAESLTEEIVEFVLTSPVNLLPPKLKKPIFDEPLVGFASGDDPLFTDYKTIIGPDHLTPREALAEAYGKKPEDLPAELTVVSYILPVTGLTRRSNRKESKMPSRPWSHTRWFGEILNDAVREFTADILTDMGYMAAAPVLQPYFKGLSNEKGPYSNWSERHVAYAAGLGTFSLSDGFITEKGIAHRCGSVVTDLVLPPTPRTAKTPFSNCVYYARGTCMKCVERCPAGAITEAGHDKIRCLEYQRGIGYHPEQAYDIETSVAGCGLCQTDVPCEHRVPRRARED